MLFDLFQIVGGLILAFCSLPQIIQIMRTKSAEGLNPNTFLLMFAGISFMEVYAIHLAVHAGSWAFLFTNTLSLVSLFILNILLIKYRE